MKWRKSKLPGRGSLVLVPTVLGQERPSTHMLVGQVYRVDQTRYACVALLKHEVPGHLYASWSVERYVWVDVAQLHPLEHTAFVAHAYALYGKAGFP